MYINKDHLKIPSSDLDLLRDALKHGDIEAISKETGYHRNTIMDVLKGRFENEEIIEAACARIREHHTKVTQQRQKIHETIQQTKTTHI